MVPVIEGVRKEPCIFVCLFAFLLIVRVKKQKKFLFSFVFPAETMYYFYSSICNILQVGSMPCGQRKACLPNRPSRGVAAYLKL